MRPDEYFDPRDGQKAILFVGGPYDGKLVPIARAQNEETAIMVPLDEQNALKANGPGAIVTLHPEYFRYIRVPIAGVEFYIPETVLQRGPHVASWLFAHLVAGYTSSIFG